MQTIRFFLLGFLFSCTYINSTAQHVYIHGIDAVAKDITFDVRTSPYTFYLNNVTNELINKPISWSNEDGLTQDEYESLTLGAINTNGLRKAICETFTETEYKTLKQGKDYMELFTVIDNEGRILEIAFYIHKSPRTEAFSPDKYALLEQNLKQYVTYSQTEDMQKLLFWRSFHRIDFDSLGILYRNLNPEIILPDSVQALE